MYFQSIGQNKQIGFDGLNAEVRIFCQVASQNFPKHGHLQCMTTSSMERDCMEFFFYVIILSYCLWHYLSMLSYNLKKNE